MRRLIGIPILALLLTATAAEAQQSQHGARRTTTLYMTMGMSVLDVGALNSALGAQGYRSMSDRFFSLGLGGHLVINQAVLGLEGEMLLAERASSTNEDNTFRASAGGKRGMLRFGYLVVEGDNLDLYPLVGVGYGTTSLEIVDPAAATFGEVLADPRRGVVLEKGGPLIGVALGGDWVFETARGRRKGPAFGFRLGYDYAPVESDWSIDGTRLLNGPDFSLSGPYLRLMLGFGGRGALVGVR